MKGHYDRGRRGPNRLPNHTAKPGDVLKRAREHKRELGTAYVDGEKITPRYEVVQRIGGGWQVLDTETNRIVRGPWHDRSLMVMKCDELNAADAREKGRAK